VMISRPRPIADVDLGAVGRGAAVALLVGGVAAVIANLADAVSDEGSALAIVLLLATLAGLVAGGWVAARASRRSPLVDGAAAALVAVLVLLVVSLVRRVVGDDDVNAAYLGVWALLALACGLAGALAAVRR
jgi:putative membrane protein (TIGR04086 family)